MNRSLEFGIDNPVYRTVDRHGNPTSGPQVIRDAIDEAILADQVGIDSYNISEHYRDGFYDSAGPVILAGIATGTQRIRLGTAVTVLSTQDPVRVYTEFATLDAISNGRAQIVVGRGSLTDSFPLFGFDLRDYDQLFEEKLDLWLQLLRDQPVTWSGAFRSALHEQNVMPPIPPGNIPTWIGVGGNPQSIIRAARYGLPLIIAAIGGAPERFAPYVDLYNEALTTFGKPPTPYGIHSHGFIADTDGEAVEVQYPHLADMHEVERGVRPSKSWFLHELEHGSLYVGSPETVATKLAASIRQLGTSRFDLAVGMGSVPHEHRLKSIELYGREVIPRVKELLATPPVASGSSAP